MNHRLSFKFYVTLVLSVCALCFCLAPSVRAQVTTIDGSKFMPHERADPNLYILPDGDVIMMTKRAANVAADEVQILLISAPTVTWRKQIGIAWTQDDRHQSDLTTRKVSTLQREGLTFYKDKGFGAHYAEMYFFRLDQMFNLGGARLTFTWLADNWPQREKGLSVSDFRPSEHVPMTPYRLRDNDVIMLTQEAIILPGYALQSEKIQIVLKSATDITWWKEVKLRMWNQAPDGRLDGYTDVMRSTKDADHGPTVIEVNAADFIRRGQLIFSKAKGLGAPWEVYKIWGSEFEIARLTTRLTFTWQRD